MQLVAPVYNVTLLRYTPAHNLGKQDGLQNNFLGGLISFKFTNFIQLENSPKEIVISSKIIPGLYAGVQTQLQGEKNCTQSIACQSTCFN